MNNAERIANDNHRHKEGAFAEYNLGTQRFHDGDGPTASEAEQHQDFPNTKSTHTNLL